MEDYGSPRGFRRLFGRRDVIAALGGAATVGWSRAVRAQSPDRVRDVAVIFPLNQDDPNGLSAIDTLRRSFRGLGWEEGRNLRLDIRWSGADVGRLRTDTSNVASNAPDVIVAISTNGLAAALAATRTIPVVFINVGDPVSAGFVATMAHPGGNATGFSGFEPAMGSKWLQVLKDAAPHMTSAAILVDSTNPAHVLFRASAEKAAPALSVALVPVVADDSDGIRRGLRSLAGKTDCGLIGLPGNPIMVDRDLVVRLPIEQRMPAIYPFKLFADAGGLIVYGIDDNALYREAASYIDRILKGEKPGDLPVQAPDTFELVLNLKTAKRMSFEFPPTFLARANEVIE